MTANERLQHLIDSLEGGNAGAFGRRCGIDKSIVSRLCSGEIRLTPYYIGKIMKAYDCVNGAYLTLEDDYPGDITISLVKAHYEALIKQKDEIIASMARQMNANVRIINKLTSEL